MDKIATNWHDRIFAIGGILLCLGTLPALFGTLKTPVWSAALIGGVLSTFAINYVTMRYWLAAATVAIQAILWFLILLK